VPLSTKAGASASAAEAREEQVGRLSNARVRLEQAGREGDLDAVNRILRALKREDWQPEALMQSGQCACSQDVAERASWLETLRIAFTFPLSLKIILALFFVHSPPHTQAWLASWLDSVDRPGRPQKIFSLLQAFSHDREVPLDAPWRA